MFVITTATRKIAALTKRIRFVSGGSSSSKTISILLNLIDYAQTHKNELISVVSESMPHLRKGAMRDFLMILQAQGYYKDPSWNATNSVYTFETGTQIEFFSADQPGKVHGPRRDVLYLNEANNISYSVYVQLEIRTKKIIFVDSNPTHEYWMYTEVMPNNDIDFITVTYKDNEALDPSIVQSLEAKKHNKDFWRVYGEGQLGVSEGRIYKDWQIIDEIPHEARLERRGLDFGYTNDPTAIVDVYRYNGGFIFDEHTYLKGLSNKAIADKLLNSKNPATLVVCDSAEPKSIDELKLYGVNAIGADKSKGSVNQGIQYIQDQAISITKRSVNGIKEYRNYLWMKDRDGKTLNVPEGGMDHFLDACRYAISTLRPVETVTHFVEEPAQSMYSEIGL
jgi:phage terminase large subunit